MKKIFALAFLSILMLLTLSACDTKNDQNYFDLGMKWLSRYSLDVAISNFNDAIRLNPNHAEAYIFRGVAWHYKRDYDKAMADFDKAEEINPGDKRSHYYRALTYFEKRNYLKSIENLEDVLKNIPDTNKPSAFHKNFQWEKDIYYSIGMAHYLMGSINEALIAYNKALTIDLKKTNYLYSKTYDALILLSRGRLFQLKGDKYKASSDFDKAISEITKKVIDNTGNPYFLYYRSYGKLFKGDYDEVVTDCNRIFGLEERIIKRYKANAYLNRGFAWQAKKNYKNAIDDYNRTIELDPKLLEAHLSLSWIMSACPDQKFRDGEKALSIAKNAVEIVRESTSFLELADTYGVLAAAHAESGNFKKAIEVQKETLNYLDKLEDNELKTYLISEAHNRMVSYKANKPWTGEWYEGRL